MKTNPNALLTCMKNSIFTNVGETADGGFFWEGLEDETPAGTEIISWTGERYKLGEDKTKKSSHPNARFCCPARQCPIIHPKWEDPAGVPISAIIFGGRRPEGVPLVVESFNWRHGVFLASQLKSETTAAAEHTGKQVMHDPFAMRPFVGYNFGRYIQHWLDFEKDPNNKVRKKTFRTKKAKFSSFFFSYRKSFMSIGFVWMKIINFFGLVSAIIFVYLTGFFVEQITKILLLNRLLVSYQKKAQLIFKV